MAKDGGQIAFNIEYQRKKESLEIEQFYSCRRVKALWQKHEPLRTFRNSRRELREFSTQFRWQKYSLSIVNSV